MRRHLTRLSTKSRKIVRLSIQFQIFSHSTKDRVFETIKLVSLGTLQLERLPIFAFYFEVIEDVGASYCASWPKLDMYGEQCQLLPIRVSIQDGCALSLRRLERAEQTKIWTIKKRKHCVIMNFVKFVRFVFFLVRMYCTVL